MRVVTQIPHPECKITVFSWNGKYLIKLETDLLEQTYKVPEWDVSGEDDIRALLTDEFMQRVMARFREMNGDLHRAIAQL